ncbi:hypothetical protein ACSMXN_20890 [Jatrophihabitans sp. DSM 45814]
MPKQSSDDGGWWARAEIDDAPELEVALRLEQTGERIWASGIKVIRRDGGELRARDLRRPLLSEAVDMARSLQGYVDPRTLAPRPPRPGPAGHSPEHFRHVWELWQRALVESPGREIKWMRNQWNPPIGDATMRRWRDTARDMFGQKGGKG